MYPSSEALATDEIKFKDKLLIKKNGQKNQA
jgi:hypothetical protein